MTKNLISVNRERGYLRPRKVEIRLTSGVVIRLIMLDPPIGKKMKEIKRNGPYFSKASSHSIDLSGGRRFKNIFEPSSGGMGRRLKTAR